MRVALIRHGMTEGNAQHRYVGGSTDEGLSCEGRALLGARGICESVQTVFTSGMRRANETAEVLFPKARIEARPDLREMEFGRFENKSFADLEHDADYRAWVEGSCEGRCPGGEDQSEFVGRCVRAFVQAAEEARARGDVCAFFVVHGGTVMAVMSELARPKRGYFETPCDHGTGWTAEWDGVSLQDVCPFATLDELNAVSRGAATAHAHAVLPSSSAALSVAAAAAFSAQGRQGGEGSC